MKSPFRTLTAIYAVAILAGLVEYMGMAQVPDNYESPVHNFSAAMSRLYPRTAGAELLLGRQFEVQAGQGFNPDEFRRQPERYKEFLNAMNDDLRRAAEHYERAIAMGLKSEEDLYYHYALTLIRLQAEPERIEEAISEWRRNFPYSSSPDLESQRRTIEEKLRRSPTGLKSQRNGAN